MRPYTMLGAACAAAALGGTASADLITFDDFSHGETVTGIGDSALTIGALNPNRPFNLAIIFDSLETGTEDPDLEGPPWARGNLAPGTVLGNLLIIAENDVDADGDGLIDRPDDEGSRPAGSLLLGWNEMIAGFGFDLVDVEGAMEAGSIDFYVDDDLMATVAFADFVDPGSMFYDSTVEFGNNSANRLAPITADMLGLAGFNGVSVNLGGSGAIDNLLFSRVPAPGAAAVMIAGLAGCRRRRRTA